MIGNDTRLRLLIRGRVQGVGFRPALYRLAQQQGLWGSLANSDAGVVVDLEGPLERLEAFVRAMPGGLPPLADVQQVEQSWLQPLGAQELEILPSEDRGQRGARIPADLAICDDCLRELQDPTDRRHGYPFINCTACGPRYTIVEAVPYDRTRTSMAPFIMCSECAVEYTEPADRRYHAEPIACPECGPRLKLLDPRGEPREGDPLELAVGCLRAGQVLAVKGLGGFHLAVDARDEQAVGLLRWRKGRRDKPLAVMVRDLQEARRHAQVSEADARVLSSVQAPIVLLRRREGSDLAPGVAPQNPYLGLMLPYSPLHRLLLGELPALVMTSGNLSEEPIVIGNREARERLGQIADLFLQHDRRILAACEDSVVASTGAGPVLLRRSRGFVPDPLTLGLELGQVLGTGGQLKNTFCLTIGREAYLGPHVGDLDSPEAVDGYQHAVEKMKWLLRLQPEAVACDLHPDYLTTRYARQLGLPVSEVQHHHAHVAAVVADRGLEGPVLGLALDGTGYGPDGTIWGGELLLLPDPGRFERVGHLRAFPLPGGDACIRRPARTALALVWELLGEAHLDAARALLGMEELQAAAVQGMLRQQVGTVASTSCGRLFDAVAALCGQGLEPTYEGQPAMELEFLAGERQEQPYPVEVIAAEPLQIDPAPALAQILADLQGGADRGLVAARFQAGLVRALARACARAGEAAGVTTVALGGGCFQNRFLARELCRELERRGLRGVLPRRVPANDGGLALGQVVVHAARSS